jgi:hypothetical protein
MEKELLSESEIIGALTACNNRKGARCSQCPVFGKCWSWQQCKQVVDKEAIKLIEKQRKKVESLEYALIGVMHSVDKWLEGDELNQNEVNRAATMREKTLQIIENLQAEIDGLRASTRENIKGEWQTVSIGCDTNEIRCTACKQITVVPADRTRKVNFCPECGADMREVRE